jgi:COMPASS component SWD3
MWQTQATLEVKGHAITTLKFSPDGDFFVSADAQRRLGVYSVETNQCLYALEGVHEQGLNDVSFSPDGKYLVSASDDKTLTLWDLHNKTPINRLVGHTHYVMCCMYSNQGNQIVSGSFDETVRFWDVRRPERPVRLVNAHSDPVSGIDLSADGTMLVTAGYDGLCRIWDSETGQCLKTVYGDTTPPVSAVQFSPNGKFVLASSLDHTIRLWNFNELNNGTCVKQYQGHVNSKYCAMSTFVTSTTESPYILAGSEDGAAYLWHVSQSKTGIQKLQHEEADGDGIVLSVAAHPTLPVIATGSSKGTIKVWNLIH